MYIILLRYRVPHQDLSPHVQAHKDYLSQQCAKGNFICCGSLLSTPGELILSSLSRRQCLLDIIHTDPFEIAGLTDCELIPFEPQNFCQGFASFLRPKDKEEINLLPHDSHWITLFHQEADILKKYFGSDLLKVHHIGSTAIPHIAAKPIIDLIPVVRNINKIDDLTAVLEADGYTAMGEFGLPQRRFFKKVTPEIKYHIHIWPMDHPEITRHVLFCEYLKKHPKEAHQYERLKKSLAAQFPDDIENYCWGKETFIRRIEKQALAEQNTQSKATSIE